MRHGLLLLILSAAAAGSGCIADHHIGDDGTSVGDGGNAGDGGVRGGQIIARGTAGAMSMAVDATNVYWLYGGQCPECSGNSAGILTVPKTGGTPTSLLTIAPRLYNIALDDAYVYATHQGQEIIRVPKVGGAAETVVSGVDYPYAIDVDDQYVYWSKGVGGSGISAGAIYRAPKAGGGPITTVYDAIANPWDLKVDATNVYYSEMNLGRIMSVPKAGGTPQVLASGWVGTGDIAIDLTNVYFTACPTGDCNQLLVYSVPKAGGTAQQLAASDGVSGAAAITVGPNRVFLGRSTGSMAGVVTSIVKTGGSLVDIATDPNGPLSVAVDANEAYVYWLDFYSGDVGRAPLQ